MIGNSTIKHYSSEQVSQATASYGTTNKPIAIVIEGNLLTVASAASKFFWSQTLNYSRKTSDLARETPADFLVVRILHPLKPLGRPQAKQEKCAAVVHIGSKTRSEECMESASKAFGSSRQCMASKYATHDE
ncbi:hypothetical protein Pyn_27655 [Prunus yedoensis var. nudiflora]|uniref:Uncharacterized protein n=1 Tax=Prunus yedoensis var. nudiflora TaxID=2094558 RepID=A0A314UL53_PRUYE|nr:hypothetical protein Pyn_27655 [Prunus yedoensis var. nudiflora]